MSKTIEIDVIPPRNFSKGLPMKEVRELFIPFIEEADLRGKFTLRCECLQKGSSSKANTIRFKWKPASSGVQFEVIHVNFQCHKPDMCFDALLIPQDTEVRVKEIYHKLCEAHKANCFVLAHRRTARKALNGQPDGPSILWGDPELQGVALNRICDIAVIDKDVFIKRCAVQDIANEIFGKEISWGEGDMAEHLIKAGMLEPFDGADLGPTQRLFVEAIAFETIGRKHPDTIREEGGAPPPPPEPEPAPPATLPGDFLAQIRTARKLIAEHGAAEARLRDCVAESKTLDGEIKVLEGELDRINECLRKKRHRTKELEHEVGKLTKVREDPAYSAARDLISELRAISAG